MIKKLAFKEKLGYAFGDMACGFAMTTISFYLMFFYTDVFGLSVGAVGTLFFVARVWDAVNDPIIGAWIDRHNFRFGKYRSLILFGAVPLALFSVLCFTAPQLSMTGKLIWAYATYIIAGMLYTLVNTSYSSLSTVMTEDPNQRTSLTSLRMYVSNIGSIALSFGVPVLAAFFSKTNPNTAYMKTAMIFAGSAVILFMITFSTTKERIHTPVSKEKVSIKTMLQEIVSNRPLAILCGVFLVTFTNITISSSIGTYFIKYNVGRADLTGFFILLISLPGLVTFALLPYLSRRFGKKRLLIAAHCISIFGLICMYFVPTELLGLLFVFRFVGAIGSTLIMGLIWDMAPDVIDYGEYTKGRRLSGVTYAIIGFFFKVGTALAGMIPGVIFNLTGYVANANQTPTALWGIKFTFIGIPLLLSLLILIPIFFYKLDNQEIHRIAKVLRQRRRQREAQDDDIIEVQFVETLQQDTTVNSTN